MTREELIRNLEYTMKKHEHDRVDTFGTNIALMCKDVLDYLWQEPCDDCAYSTKDGCCQYDDIAETIPPIEPCKDAIKREAVLNTLDEMDAALDENRTVEAYKELLKEYYKLLPPVTPQPKTGHWIYDYVSADGHRVYHCSECGCYLKPKHSEPLNSFKWCSLCGAKMERE